MATHAKKKHYKEEGCRIWNGALIILIIAHSSGPLVIVQRARTVITQPITFMYGMIIDMHSYTMEL